MKRHLFVLAVISFSMCLHAQDRGIGLRLGTPLGITYKKYFPRVHRAIELGIGTAPAGWNKYYYENSFHDFDRYEGFEYRSHKVISTVYGQARYLIDYNIPIDGLIGKLDWYWGIGGLIKFASVEYVYHDPLGPDMHRTATDFDFGPEGIIGMEYTFERLPMTVFGEVSLMIELADRLGTARGFSGLGLRYNF